MYRFALVYDGGFGGGLMPSIVQPEKYTSLSPKGSCLWVPCPCRPRQIRGCCKREAEPQYAWTSTENEMCFNGVNFTIESHWDLESDL